MARPGRVTMRHPRHAHVPRSTATRPPEDPSRRPLGVQRLSRKTWDKVREAIRALERVQPTGPAPAQPVES